MAISKESLGLCSKTEQEELALTEEELLEAEDIEREIDEKIRQMDVKKEWTLRHGKLWIYLNGRKSKKPEVYHEFVDDYKPDLSMKKVRFEILRRYANAGWKAQYRDTFSMELVLELS